MTADHVLSLRDAVLGAVRDGADLTDVLAEALGRAAVELGSVRALVGGRDGREADAVRTLAGWAHPGDVLPFPRTEERYVYLRDRQLTEQQGGPPNERWPDETCRPELRGGIG